jgi:hypothetical protein
MTNEPIRQRRRQRLTLTLAAFTSGLALAQAAHETKLWLILAAASAANAAYQFSRLARADTAPQEATSTSSVDRPASI